MKVSSHITRYGIGVRHGGWDGESDSGTDAWLGCFDNKLNTSSCALTISMEKNLADSLASDHPALMRDQNHQIIPGKLKPYTLLKVTFLAPNTQMVFYRTFDDRAPENDPRCDLFLPWKDDPSIPDNGFVEVV